MREHSYREPILRADDHVLIGVRLRVAARAGAEQHQVVQRQPPGEPAPEVGEYGAFHVSQQCSILSPAHVLHDTLTGLDDLLL